MATPNDYSIESGKKDTDNMIFFKKKKKKVRKRFFVPTLIR